MGKFTLKSVHKISDLAEKALSGEKVELGESDLAVQNDEYLMQFKYKTTSTTKKKYKIKTGTFNLEATNAGIICEPMDLKPLRLLETNNASKQILDEFQFFFDRLEVYKELDLPPKRGVLLYGPPGTGKTANVSKAVNKLIENDDTAVITWNASSIRSSDVLDFFTTGIEYDKKVKKLVVLIEDIGMGVDDGYGGSREIDRSLLNLLDGSGSVVTIPTFFVATTNYAQHLPEPLVRPGRFDQWIEVANPSAEERVELYKFIAKQETLSDEDEVTLRGKELNGFSVAHLKELVIRCKRDGISITEAVNQLSKLRKKFDKNFNDYKPAGLLG
jgi:SpoVK/Ycf46/Vps4 family AAA+-type ATPase